MLLNSISSPLFYPNMCCLLVWVWEIVNAKWQLTVNQACFSKLTIIAYSSFFRNYIIAYFELTTLTVATLAVTLTLSTSYVAPQQSQHSFMDRLLYFNRICSCTKNKMCSIFLIHLLTSTQQLPQVAQELPIILTLYLKMYYHQRPKQYATTLFDFNQLRYSNRTLS